MKAKLLLLLTIITTQLFAQAPVIQWEKSYGGSANDVARCIIPTFDGGYAVAGNTSSDDSMVTGHHLGLDFWVIKIDAFGNLQWQKDLGGLYSDQAFSIVQTPDSGFVVSGTSESNDGEVSGNHAFGLGDYWLLKLNSAGVLQWQKCYGGTSFDNGYQAINTSDGGFAFIGAGGSLDGDMNNLYGGNDFWLVKTDDTGHIEFQKVFGGSTGDYGYSVVQANDGGYVMTGMTLSNDIDVNGNHGGDDYWVVKCNDTGMFVWQTCLGSTGGDNARWITKSNDGGFVVVGSAGENDGNVTGFNGVYDYWAVKLDSLGGVVWQKCYGGYNDDKAYSVTPTQDGGFAILGFEMSEDTNVTGNHGNNHDFWLVKIDANGNKQWEHAYGGQGDEDGYSVIQIADGSFVLAGNSNGANGDVSHGLGQGDFWVVKLTAAGSSVYNLNQTVTVDLFPNPVSSELTISSSQLTGATISISDISGRELLHDLSVLSSKTLNLKSLVSGIYFLRVESEDGSVTVKKFIKE